MHALLKHEMVLKVKLVEGTRMINAKKLRLDIGYSTQEVKVNCFVVKYIKRT